MSQLNSPNAAAFAALHEDHARELRDALGVPKKRVRVVGAGYAKDIFSSRGARAVPGRIVYAGKLSFAKGVPWLLDAVESLERRGVECRLHLAGDGRGSEADTIRRRAAALGDRVVLHGQLAQQDLAALLRTAWVFALPSFYEGLPLTLVEALACGARVVTTDLLGVRHVLRTMSSAGTGDPDSRLDDRDRDEASERRASDWLTLVSLPRLSRADRPNPEDLPAFTEELTKALADALDRPQLDPTRPELAARLGEMTWGAVFRRIESLWRRAIEAPD